MPPKSTKRSSDTGPNAQSASRNKKRKTGGIMEYMNQKPQSPSKSSRSSQREDRDGKSEIPRKSKTLRAPVEKATSKETDSKQDEQQEPVPERNAASREDSTEAQDNDDASPTSKTLSLPESTGDIFNAPKGSLIIHSCNCQGSWGAGIAAAFRKNYPAAYKLYAARCKEWGVQLFESAQLIPPQDLDGKGHFVGCLYTSRHFGKKKDSPGKILDATAPAMEDLLRKVQNWNEEHKEVEKVKEVRMCMINSGLFAVPWEKTRAALEEIGVSEFDVKEVKIISREE